MADRILELARDLQAHWDDSYWWLDHQALKITLLSIASGIIGLMFCYLQARIERAARA